MNQEYQQCQRCIMDTSDEDITFDENGICRHCQSFDEEKEYRLFSKEEGQKALDKLVASIKSAGNGKDYDCIVGVSGGVDSTYVAYLAKKLGLRPLAIHFDNGWNSELAVSNIEKVLKKLDIDLYTYVIHWEEFRSLQLSFLKNSTPDGEIPTDHAINALLFQEANKRGIKYIINGMNFRTEQQSNLNKWAYGHADWKYIRSVHRIFGGKRLKHYPHYSLLSTFWYLMVKRIKLVSILNYIEFNKAEAMELLQNELDWVYYGGKHYESVYTCFYQAYILPRKFNVDKRLIHYSSLIRCGQMTREDALEQMKAPLYDPQLEKEDKAFVMKKLKLDEQQFDEIMAAPTKYYYEYPNNANKVKKLKSILNFFRKKGIMSK